MTTVKKARVLALAGAAVALGLVAAGIVVSENGDQQLSSALFGISPVISLGCALPVFIIGFRNELRRFRGQDEIE